jgi:hypothetical protein
MCLADAPERYIKAGDFPRENLSSHLYSCRLGRVRRPALNIAVFIIRNLYVHVV